MKHIHYLYIAAFTFLIACSSEERIQTTDHTSGPIELSAGIVESPSKATTRGLFEDTHQALTVGTQLALQISGTWTGHDPSPVIQTTTATVGAETPSGSRKNSITCNPVRYWDEYGSADPDNATTGRTEGLTIYGAAVDNKATATTGVNGLLGVADWTAFQWTLPEDQNVSGSYPADKDLLISNNVKGAGNTYLFAYRTSGKLLEFTHALSKITVKLTAGAGFDDTNSDSKNDFASNPVVELTSNVANSTANSNWALITGKVNITTGAVDITSSGQGTPAVINMYRNGSSTSHLAIMEALVMPGSQFTSDGAIIARINADGNIYYVTAQKIRAAISASHASEGAYSTEAGKNYIIKITVNKTSIDVTATVANWTDVTAAEEAPVINVAGSFGGGSGSLSKDYFSFYRSTLLNTGYGTSAGTYYTEERRAKLVSENWTLGVGVDAGWTATPLYWPNHNTHYQFRGVWPCTGTETGVVVYPRVETATHSATQYQVIKVSNVAYSANTFPSDLQIARPEIHDNYGNIDNTKKCNNSDHESVSLYDVGICATEGTINLNFRYMMSRVDVNLTTSKSEDVDYPATVNLNKAQVEIVNVHKTGDVKLGDREVIPTGVKSATPDPATDTFGNYILGNYSYNDGTKTATYSSAIVPQTLTYTSALHSNNVMFRITIYKNGDPSQGVDDIYYADIDPILNSAGTAKVAPNGKWESGVHYVYNLRLTKTNVQVTASLTNWSTVNADHTVWF